MTNRLNQRRSFGFLALAGLLLLSLASSGCTPMRMLVPQDLRANTNRLPLKSEGGFFSKRTIRFGEFVADDVRTGFRSGSRVQIMGIRVGGSKQGYSFLMHRGQSKRSWETRCMIKVKMGGVALGGVSITARRRRLRCSMISPGGKRKWMLNFGFRDERTANQEGDILMGKRLIRIAPTFSIQGSSVRLGLPSGFVFQFRGRLVGAVDLLNGGIVYLRRDLPPFLRRAVAMGSVAMLVKREQRRR